MVALRGRVRPGLPLAGALALLLLLGGAVAQVAGGAPAKSTHPIVGSAAHSAAIGPTAKLRPHPSPVPVTGSASGPRVYSSHWWSGTDYSGLARNTTQAKVTLKIPDAVPSSSEFYYVLLSAWDNAGSYDQIGISNDYGTWGWTWSYTSNCAGTFNYTPNQMALQRGVSYTFAMNISSKGLEFAVQKAGAWVGQVKANSGGTHFLMAAMYTCSTGATYYDYTDYEEVYYSVQTQPSFEFVFTANAGNNRTITNWSVFQTSGAYGTVAFKAGSVKLENQGFWLTFGTGGDSASLPQGTLAYSTNITVAHIYNAGKVTLTAGGLPSGVTAKFTPAKGYPRFVSVLNLTLSPTLAKGTYVLSITATDGSSNYTYLDLSLSIT